VTEVESLRQEGFVKEIGIKPRVKKWRRYRWRE